MINILFFASVREQLGVERLNVACVQNIDALISALIAEYGVKWESILRAPNIIIAVNHEVVTRDHALRDGDEIAFFPPVTGG